MDFLQALRDLPRRYLREDGSLDHARIALDLGITTNEEWGRFLLQLYRRDPGIRARVDDLLVEFVLMEKVKGRLPLTEVPPSTEVAWVRADVACDACPGSEMMEPIAGRRTTRCMCDLRVERWEGCGKYRENLRVAQARVDAGDPELLEEIRAGLEARRNAMAAFERSIDARLSSLTGER